VAKLILLFTEGGTGDNQLDSAWADQFVAANARVRAEKAAQGLVALDRDKQRAPNNPGWATMVAQIKQAAAAAGSGGIVLLLGGHSASACLNADGSLNPRCDQAAQKAGTITLDPAKKVRFTQDTVFYDQKATPYDLWTPKGRDQEIVGDPKRKNTPEGRAAQERLTLRARYEEIGKALRDAGLERFTFLSCAVGASPLFMDKLAKDWGVEVVAFKRKMVLDPNGTTAPGSTKQRVLLYLQGLPPQTQGEKEKAEIYTPAIFNSPNTYRAMP
jgi:hypothetical protein